MLPGVAQGAPGWRGVFFNPRVAPDPNFPWLLYYGDKRPSIRTALADVAARGINLVDLFLIIPNSLAHPPQGNRLGEPLEGWANTAYLDNVALFVDDCHAARLSVELDVVDNRWIPYTVDPAGAIGKPGEPWWPVAGPEPWRESAEWYRAIITEVERRARHPEAIAMWCMMGNYTWGSAEPMLWDDTSRPEIGRQTEQFVKHVWPAFRSAGKRPKAAPILLPIFAEGGYWQDRKPADRLSGISNLKRWLVDDLKLPPDYWVMSSYAFSDPASDGVRYLREIVRMLGRGSARKLLSTDLKGPGHDSEVQGSIIHPPGRLGPESLAWHVAKCRELGLAGWWIWAYQDTPTSETGLRSLSGEWKPGLLKALGLR